MKIRKAGKSQAWQAEVLERKEKDKVLDENC
jgi:hypothetical protein